jgi:hypothetical protein
MRLRRGGLSRASAAGWLAAEAEVGARTGVRHGV